MRIVIEN